MTASQDVEQPTVQRRLRCTVQVDADDLDSLYSELTSIAHDLLAEGREQREVQSGGYSASHSLLLVQAEDGVDGVTYRHALAEWMERRKHARRETARRMEAAQDGGQADD